VGVRAGWVLAQPRGDPFDEAQPRRREDIGRRAPIEQQVNDLAHAVFILVRRRQRQGRLTSPVPRVELRAHVEQERRRVPLAVPRG